MNWMVAAAMVAGLLGAGGLGAIIVNQMTIRAKERDGSREITLVNELQEERKELIARIGRQDKRIDLLQKQNRQVIAYVLTIHQHFAEGKPPPPPPIPPELFNI